MPELHLPWIELAIVLPLIGAVIVGLTSNRDAARVRCLMVCILTLACAVAEWIDFNSLHTFEAHDHWDAIEAIFHRDVFVIDELSAPLLPLGALLYLMTVLSTLRTKVNRFSFGWTLFAESLLLATLSCRGSWVLIGLLALATLPPWIELRSRGQSTRVYVIHMSLFVVLMVAGYALSESPTLARSASKGDATAANQNNRGSSDDGSFGSTSSLARRANVSWLTILSGALLTASALLRSGIVPVHCWMADLFHKATFGTALLFVAPMTGAYAVMRLVLPVAPDWALQSIAIVSLITAVYAAGMALVQTDARRFFCYLFLSHSSLVLVGMELVTPIGLTGALCVWLSVGLSLGGFGLTLRSVESRTGPLDQSRFHGLYEHMPMLASLFLLTGLASIGFPGTVGFIGTELLVEGAVEVYPLIGMTVVIAAGLNGVAILYAYFRIFTGTKHTASISLRARAPERIAVLILAALIIGGGLFPQPGVASRYHAAVALMEHRSVALAHDTHVSPQRQQGQQNIDDAEHQRTNHVAASPPPSLARRASVGGAANSTPRRPDNGD